MTVRIIKPAPPLINALRSQLPHAPYLHTYLTQFAELLDNSIGTIQQALAGNSLSLFSQTASIQGSTLFTTNNSGLYLISVQHEVSALGTAGKLRTTINWTDEVGAKSRIIATDLDLTTMDEEDGISIVRIKGGVPVTFSSILNGATGTPAFNLFIYAKEMS